VAFLFRKKKELHHCKMDIKYLKAMQSISEILFNNDLCTEESIFVLERLKLLFIEANMQNRDIIKEMKNMGFTIPKNDVGVG